MGGVAGSAESGLKFDLNAANLPSERETLRNPYVQQHGGWVVVGTEPVATRSSSSSRFT